MKIPCGTPSVGDDDISEVVKVLKSNWLTTGPKVAEFEKNFCKYIGSKYAVAVSSGTAALDLAVLALGLPEGSEVITTPLWYISTGVFLHFMAFMIHYYTFWNPTTLYVPSIYSFMYVMSAGFFVLGFYTASKKYK